MWFRASLAPDSRLTGGSFEEAQFHRIQEQSRLPRFVGLLRRCSGWTFLGFSVESFERLIACAALKICPYVRLPAPFPSSAMANRRLSGGSAQSASFNGQTSTTPWATAHGTRETFSMASAKSMASITANPAIGKDDDMNAPLRVSMPRASGLRT